MAGRKCHSVSLASGNLASTLARCGTFYLWEQLSGTLEQATAVCEQAVVCRHASQKPSGLQVQPHPSRRCGQGLEPTGLSAPSGSILRVSSLGARSQPQSEVRTGLLNSLELFVLSAHPEPTCPVSKGLQEGAATTWSLTLP